jgi:hypothetical protein
MRRRTGIPEIRELDDSRASAMSSYLLKQHQATTTRHREILTCYQARDSLEQLQDSMNISSLTVRRLLLAIEKCPTCFCWPLKKFNTLHLASPFTLIRYQSWRYPSTPRAIKSADQSLYSSLHHQHPSTSTTPISTKPNTDHVNHPQCPKPLTPPGASRTTRSGPAG